MYEDPSAAAVRFQSTNFDSFGPPDVESCLAAAHRSYGNLRRTAFTRPSPSPAFYPPERTSDVPPEKADYTWTWPERETRPPPPRLKRPTQVSHTSFLEEYELRPPWLKY